jgi:predicted AAA+ superfamily ATPase
MIKQHLYIDKITKCKDLPIAKAIVGVRRCRKSNIIIQYMKYLKSIHGIDDKHIAYVDFEDIKNDENIYSSDKRNK